MYIKLAGGGVEDPIQRCSVAIMIEINNEELYLLNILYYHVNILLLLNYMDSVYTHHIYQPRSCCLLWNVEHQGIMSTRWFKYMQHSHQLDHQMFTYSSVKNTTARLKERHKDSKYRPNSADGSLLKKWQTRWKSFPHLHKYRQPSALVISEAWLDDRAPDGRVVSGSSRAFTIDRKQQR